MRSKVLCVLAVLVGAAAAQVSDSNLPLPTGVYRVYADTLNGNDVPSAGSQANPYRTISYAYQQLAAVAGPAVVVVNDGVYSPANGESFPVQMRTGHLVMGRNAHSVIVDGGGFAFTGFSFDYFQTPTGFAHADGPYLQRMTVRGFTYGVYLAGPFSGCDVVAPTFDALVMYENAYAIAGEMASPWIFDCTITQNVRGIYKYVFAGMDCCQWLVRNTVCVDNSLFDLFDIPDGEIDFSNFDLAKCGLSAVGVGQCGYVLPTPGANGNVFVLPVGFIDATGGSTLAVSGLTAARDLRLESGSAMIGAGISTGALWDGEGMGNYRTGPRRNRAVDMGADQYNDLRAYPLAVGTNPLAVRSTQTYVSVAGEDLAFRIESAGNATHFGALNDFTALPLPPLNPPLVMQGTAGSLWVFPVFSLMSFAWAAGGPPQVVSFQIDGPTTAVAPVNATLGIVLPYTTVAPLWTRCTLQFLTAEQVAPFNRLTELQDYPFVF